MTINTVSRMTATFH